MTVPSTGDKTLNKTYFTACLFFLLLWGDPDSYFTEKTD